MPKAVFINSFRAKIAESVCTCDDDFLLNLAFLMIRISDLKGTTFTSVHPLFLKSSFYDDLREILPTEPPMRGLPKSLRGSEVTSVHSESSIKRKAALPPKKNYYGVHLVREDICPTDLSEIPANFLRWNKTVVIDTSKRLVLEDFTIEPIFLDFSFVFKTRPTGGS